MKRFQTTKTPLRKLRLVLSGLVVAAGMLVTAPAATAAVTEAPEIVSAPVSPQTTSATTEFTYTAGEDETSTVSPLRFYCRAYPTATPPTPTASWQACGLSTDEQPLAKTHSGNAALANGSLTFEVAVRETSNVNTQGPIASHVWTQNIPVPSLPPVLTGQPDDPLKTLPVRFDFEPASEETDLVDRFQCRIDEGGWLDCTFRTEWFRDNLENGEHNFEVRSGNVVGYGPSTAFTWTVDVPNPEPSVRVQDEAITRLDGNGVGGVMSPTRSSAHGPVGIGDVNGDGYDDMAAATGSSVKGDAAGVYVVFGSQSGLGSRDVETLDADDGFRIQSPSTTGSNYVRNFRPVSDQNGDGIPDLVVAAGSDGPAFAPIYKIFVVYGGTDPHELPLCPGSTVARCLDLTDITDDQGYILESPTAASLTGQGIMDVLDFNGDGIDDIAMGYFRNEVYVVSGGVRAGTTDVTTLPPEQLFKATRAIPGLGGGGIGAVDDLNGDGKEDLFVGEQTAGGGHFLFGRELGSTLDLADFSPADGIWLAGSYISAFEVENLGDLNRDGRPELAVSNIVESLRGADATTVLYGPALPTSDPLLTGDDLIPGTGYLIEAGGIPGFIGEQIENISDFDNDGTPDLIATAPRTPVDGAAGGGAYIVFGSSETRDEPVELGPKLTPETGVAMLEAGTSATSLGDIDGDGLTDFAVGETNSVYIVPGKKLINQVKTQTAVAVGNESAVVNAGLSSNNRDSEVWFEYGTSEDYGSATESQSFDGSNTGDAASAALSGLKKNTTYHYRAVAKNELGLVRYGDDKTFTTTNTADPKPVSNCDTDSTLPGCKDYDHCKAVPADCDGGTNTDAKLTLITSPKTIKVKRGKKGTVSAIVVNSGGKSASGVKVCVKAPKKFVKVKKCLTVGSLASGATKTKTFKVKVKKKARKGKKVALKFTASGKGLSAKKATAKVRVR